MPKLFLQILNQKGFQKSVDAKLELQAKVAKKKAEIELLKQEGISLKDAADEDEQAKETLYFLKEYDRKIAERAQVRKVINRNERKRQKKIESVYGPPQEFMEAKQLLSQKVPVCERKRTSITSTAADDSISLLSHQKGAVSFAGMQSRAQMDKHGFKGTCSRPDSAIHVADVSDLSRGANSLKSRTDKGNVRFKSMTGRSNDYLIRNRQEYKNIQQENSKMDYLTRNFCKPNKGGRHKSFKL